MPKLFYTPMKVREIQEDSSQAIIPVRRALVAMRNREHLNLVVF